MCNGKQKCKKSLGAVKVENLWEDASQLGHIHPNDCLCPDKGESVKTKNREDQRSKGFEVARLVKVKTTSLGKENIAWEKDNYQIKQNYP